MFTVNFQVQCSLKVKLLQNVIRNKFFKIATSTVIVHVMTVVIMHS